MLRRSITHWLFCAAQTESEDWSPRLHLWYEQYINEAAGELPGSRKLSGICNKRTKGTVLKTLYHQITLRSPFHLIKFMKLKIKIWNNIVIKLKKASFTWSPLLTGQPLQELQLITHKTSLPVSIYTHRSLVENPRECSKRLWRLEKEK